jgi:hypothetical protein
LAARANRRGRAHANKEQRVVVLLLIGLAALGVWLCVTQGGRSTTDIGAIIEAARRDAEADIRRSNLESSKQLTNEKVCFRSDTYALTDKAMYFFASPTDNRIYRRIAYDLVLTIRTSTEIGFENGAGKEWVIIETKDLTEPAQRFVCGREKDAAAMFMTRLRTINSEFGEGSASSDT